MRIRTSQADAANGLSTFDGKTHRSESWSLLPASLDIKPVGRWPLRLREETERIVLERPLPPPSTEQLTVAVDWPQVTIVVPSYNNLVFTRMCLESVLVNTRDLGFELVVVDNGSTDGTRSYLYALARRDPRVRPLLNATNQGFAAAVNQGLQSGRGDYFIVLNNDTLVPPETLATLTDHLKDPDIGLVGSATNRIANEAQIETSYQTYGQMLRFAAFHCRQHRGRTFDIRTIIMFCVAFRRDLYEKAGPLDEGYGIGLFEDEDYSRRVQQLGLRLICAEDVFVHHFGEATTGEITGDGGYGKLFQINRSRYEEKWGVEWIPHQHRVSAQYEQSIREFRRAVCACTPGSASVLVVSRGDSAFLDLVGRSAFHFPCSDDGSFLGYYPASSQDAINLLERMKNRGAKFLAFPDASRWWLDHYQEFHQHLIQEYSIRYQDSPCLVFDLRKSDDTTRQTDSDNAGLGVDGSRLSKEDPS